MKKWIIIFIVVFIYSSKSGIISDGLKIYKMNEIPENAVKMVNNAFLYEVKFSNLIYDVKGKKIIIPIFHGTLRDVEYKDFVRYCREKKILDDDASESGFVIRAKKGELKKTLLDFIKFYHGNILKGYEKSYEMFPVGDEPQYLEWLIIYKFKIDNIPCTLKISVSADKKDWDISENYKKLKIEDIHPDEEYDPLIVYEIYVDYWE